MEYRRYLSIFLLYGFSVNTVLGDSREVDSGDRLDDDSGSYEYEFLEIEYIREGEIGILEISFTFDAFFLPASSL